MGPTYKSPSRPEAQKLGLNLKGSKTKGRKLGG